MLIYAVILFGVAALGGLVMAIQRRGGSNPPLALAVLHGLLAATGLVLLIVVGMQDGFGGNLGIALVLLVVAALGGFVLIASHLRGQLISLALVGVHAVAAVVGYVFLLLAAF